MTTILLSIFENADSEPLSKRLSLTPEGNLTKTAAAELAQGQVTQHAISNLKDLGELMTKLPSSQAVAFGICPHKSAAVMSQKRAARYRGHGPMVTRTRPPFGWSKGPGVLLLDYDPPPGAKALSADDLVAALREAVPELRDVTMMMKPSVSSCIYDDQGRELAGIKGQHVFLICKDAERIPEIGNLVAERLWLAVHGYIRVSDNGRMLERTIIDSSVWQPERLVFGGAACGAGLRQRFPAPRIFPGECDDLVGECWLDPSELRPLTQEEIERVSCLKAEAKNAKQDEAKRKQAEWIERRAKEAAGENADTETLERHRESFRRAVTEGDVMPPELILYPQDANPVAAAEVWKNPDTWHGKRFADPFEPEYTGDPRIALAVLKDCAEPYIHSHAHGGLRYSFRSEAERFAEIAADFNVVSGEFKEETTDACNGNPFKLIQAEDFANRPPPQYLIDDVLPHAGLAVIYGETGSGKSFVALDMAMAVCRGSDWNKKKTKQGRVIYVCAEGAGGFCLRLRAYAIRNEIILRDLPFHIIDNAPNLLQKEDAKKICDSILQSGPADTIIFDTFAQVTPGSDENTGKDMGRALENCKKIHRATSALIILVHHAGKDLSKGARGWSGLKAAADAEIEISRNGKARTIRISKQKDGRDGDAWAFRLVPQLLNMDSVNNESCVVEIVGPAMPYLRQPKGKWQRAVLNAVHDLGAATGAAVPKKDVIAKASDGASAPGPGKRDRRREYAERGLELLHKAGDVIIENDAVSLPQFRKSPQSGNCGAAA